MTIYQTIILALWLALTLFWVVMAAGVKRTIGAWRWRRELPVRIVVIVLLVVALRSSAVRQELSAAQLEMNDLGPALGIVGVVICATGAWLAIWARVHIGRNWGMPMSQKADPELVTTGPYRLVRHPIYTGILVAMLGSAIAASPIWAIVLVPVAIHFVYCAKTEEALMISQFSEAYREYAKRTKMFLPHVV